MSAFSQCTFTGELIEVDGNTYTDCVFTRCVMIFRGVAPPSLRNCVLNDCTWQFEGQAGLTIQFMKAMYHGGFKAVVDEIIQTITTAEAPAPAAPTLPEKAQ